MKKIVSTLMCILLFVSISTQSIFAVEKDVSQQEMNFHSAMILQNNQSDDKSVTYKKIIDLDGNEFTLVETGSKGYYIYDRSSGKYLEWSSESPSPYLGYDKDLYYFGPTGYYVKSGSTFNHTIESSNKIEKSDLNTRQSKFSKALSDSRKMINTKLSTLSQYIKDKTHIKDFSQIMTSNDYINYYGYIRYAQYPANVDGTCGYTAACLILNYWHKVKGNVIASQYLTSSGNLKTTGYTLQDKLVSYGGSNDSWGKTIRDALIDYCNDYGVYATSSYYLGQIGVAEELDNNRPAILFGWLTSNPSAASTVTAQGKVFHAVTTYGTNGTYYICHYGWSGYEHVLLDGGLIGSCTLFQIND